MKKLAILAVLGLAVSAQAVSITWAVGGDLYGVNAGTATKAFTGTARNEGYWSDDFKTGNPAFVLVYLGLNASATTADKVTDQMIKQTVSASTLVTQSGTTAKMGKASIVQSFNAENVAGATYQVFFSYDGVLKDIYSDAAMSTAAAVTTTVVQDATTGLFSANPSPIYAAGTSSSASYVAVPEPSTAMLALAGLALLIKRRKA